MWKIAMLGILLLFKRFFLSHIKWSARVSDECEKILTWINDDTSKGSSLGLSTVKFSLMIKFSHIKINFFHIQVFVALYFYPIDSCCVFHNFYDIFCFYLKVTAVSHPMKMRKIKIIVKSWKIENFSSLSAFREIWACFGWFMANRAFLSFFVYLKWGSFVNNYKSI